MAVIKEPAMQFSELSGDIQAMYLESLTEETCNLAQSITHLITSEKIKIYLCHCAYHKIVWDKDSLFPDADGNQFNEFTKPVGMVLRGTLEVTEDFSHSGADASRRRTTALIRPGGFFGLFESVADLHGAWRITSGVTRIFISTRIGANKIKHNYGLSDVSNSLKATLSCSKEANFDYQELLKSVNSSEWTTDLLIFDLGRIKDVDILGHLKDKTIQQLRSLVRQNPTESHVMRISSHDKVWNPDNIRATATVRAILQGDLPVFRLATEKDEALLPYSGLIKRLRCDGNNKLKPHIFVPDYVSSSSSSHEIYLYIDVLSGKVDPNVFGQVLSQMASARIRMTPTELSVISFNKINADGGEISVEVSQSMKDTWKFCYKAVIKVESKQFEIYHTVGMKEEYSSKNPKVNFHLPEQFEKLLFPNPEKHYTWPPHLRSMIVFFPKN